MERYPLIRCILTGAVTLTIGTGLALRKISHQNAREAEANARANELISRSIL